MADLSEKKLTKRLKLLEAASELFLEKGVNTTAIDEVVKRAGVAKGTFYLYFRDKYDLMDQIVLHKSTLVFRNAMAKLRLEAAKKPLTLNAQVRFIADYIIDYLAGNRELVSLIKKNLSACLRLVFESEDNEITRDLEDLFCQLEERGKSRKDTQKFLYLLTSMISSICCDAILYGEPYSIDEIRPQIHEIIDKLIP